MQKMTSDNEKIFGHSVEEHAFVSRSSGVRWLQVF